MKHGGSLTVNPDTGLPEANFLKSLLPMLAGFALNAFVPGLGSAIGGALGTSAAVGTGIAVGGITGLATGSLSKGLMAGLGAYGGAGLGEGLMGAGGSQLVAGGAPIGAENIAGTAVPPIEQVNPSNFNLSNADRLGAGFKALGTEAGRDAVLTSMGGGVNALKYAGAAASPIMADMMVPTTTKSAPIQSPGRIREKRWNGQYFEDVASTDANVYNTSGRNFSDLYRGYNGGGIVALAEGGIPGFAGNEFSFVKDASGLAQADINAALAAELGARGGSSLADIKNYAKTGYNLSDAQINAALDTIPGFNAQGAWDKNDYLANDKVGKDYQLQVDAANAANPFSAQNMANVDVTRPGHYVTDPTTGKPVALTYYSPGFDINNKTALTYLGELSNKGAGDTASQWFNQNATAAQKAEADRLWTAEKARLEALDVAAGRIPASGADTKAPTGLAQLDTTTKAINEQSSSKPPTGETEQQRNTRLFTAAGGDWNKAAALRTAEDKALVADPNYWTNKAGLAALDPGASETTKWFAARGLGFDPIDQVIDNFLLKYKPELAAMLPKEQEAAMRAALDKEKLNEADVIKATGKTIAQLAAAKRADGSIIVPGNLKDVPVDSLPGGVSGGGDTQVNANGTITTRPDLTSLTTKDVRDAYTKGGGSLGYTSPSFDKIEDFNAKYVDRMSGDSRAAYDYLTGKTGAAYPTKSGVGQIARPYDEAVLGYPARGNLPFTYDKATGKMVRNMDYVAPGRDDKGNVTYTMSLNDIKKSLTDTPLSGQALYDWAQTNNVSAQQIADATNQSLSQVYAQFRAGAKAKVAADKKVADDKAVADAASSIDNTQSGGGGGDGGDARGGLMPNHTYHMAMGGMSYSGGGLGTLGGYSDGGRLLKGPGDGVSDSIPATIGQKQQPARLADGEFVVPARIVSELGNGSTDAGAKKLYAMMDRVQRARGKTTGKNKVAANSRADKYLPA